MHIVTVLRPIPDGSLTALIEAAPGAMVCSAAGGRIALSRL
jgi:hypothetical protein